jgi:hypothetical protein
MKNQDFIKGKVLYEELRQIGAKKAGKPES